MKTPKNQIDPNAIPGTGSVKKTELTRVELKNVLVGDEEQTDLSVEVVPFNRRNDQHVEFAYAYSDMLFKAPSPFKTVSDAAREYVRLFMAHAKDDESNPDSDFLKVYKDLRACRTLFHQDDVMKAMNDFFENA
jgi:hypothetical protein